MNHRGAETRRTDRPMNPRRHTKLHKERLGLIASCFVMSLRGFRILLCAISVSLCLCGSIASAQNIKLPPVSRATLNNGIRIVLMEYHKAPTITVIAQFPGGTSTDSADRAGRASMTADLIRKGTESRNAQQIAEQIDFLGATLDTSATLDRFTVSLDAMAKDSGAGLDLMADVIRHPTFPAEEIERQRQLDIAGLESLAEDPGAVAQRVAREMVYAGHPYGLESTITSLKAISRDDIADCYHQYFVPDRMTVIAVGDFAAPQMLDRLKARFGNWPKANPSPVAVAPVPPARHRHVMIDKADATQTQVRWIRTAIARTSSDYFPAEVASSILGGGFTSRLTDEIRVNRSLTYGIGSNFSENLHGGVFGVSSFTKIETTRALIDATDAVLRKTATQGFTPTELTKVKGYLAGTFATSMETPEALAGQLADIAFFNLPNDYLTTYLTRLRSVTLPQVGRIAKTYFDPAGMSLILVAPAQKVDKQLRGLGPFETRPVEAVGK